MRTFGKSNCEMLDDYLSETLESELHVRFEEHLHQCDCCASAVSDWQLINVSLKQSFDSIVMPNPDRILDAHAEHNPTSIETMATRVLSLAAIVLLTITIAITWFTSEQSIDPGSQIARQPSDNTSINDQSVMYADVIFDEKTIAQRKCDDSEITVYQVFPKITLRTVE